jgi:hypothetical protein
MGGMKNEDVERLLKELPSEATAPDFTERVLSRLDARARRRRSRRAALVAAAALVAGAVLASGYFTERYERSRTAEKVESLRTEYRELKQELDELRALARQLEPVLELGGTDDVEFVFDLRELAPAKPENDGSRPRAEPASHRER